MVVPPLPRVPAVLLALVLGSIAPVTGAAQGWGEFSREELFSRHFEDAPGADAVILSDHGLAHVDEKLRLRVRHYRRTKIFNEAGASRGVVWIPYREDEEIQNIRGITMVPPDKKVKLEKKHIREERRGDRRFKVVSFPEVQPGVLLELSYDRHAKLAHRIEPWVFQHDDYTRSSRFDLQLPLGLTYQAEFGWMPEKPPAPREKIINDPDRPRDQMTQASWSFEGLQPPRVKPLTRGVDGYRTMLYVQLGSYSPSNQQNRDLAAVTEVETQGTKGATIVRTWGDLAASIASALEKPLQKKVPGWEGAGADPESEARAVFERVRDEIALNDDWIDWERPNIDLGKLSKERSAPPAAKNLLLVKLLRARGVKADPVLIRSRQYGSVVESYRNVDQFDHLIARLELGGRVRYLDAAVPYASFDALPPVSRASKGLLLTPEGRLFDMQAEYPSSIREAKTNARLSNSGDLSARSTWTLTGDEAWSARRGIADDDEQIFARSLLAPRFPA